MTISWSDITAEAGNYKDGFVSLFQKYEGADTDERDRSNRVVKVTTKSFAEHMGIPVQTFRDWVRAAVDTEFVSAAAKKQRTAASHANVVKNMARDARQLADAIELAGPAVLRTVSEELLTRRSKLSPADRKAANAAARAAFDPIFEVVAQTNVELCIAALVDAAESLRDAREEGHVSKADMRRIQKALEKFQLEIAETNYAVS